MIYVKSHSRRGRIVKSHKRKKPKILERLIHQLKRSGKNYSSAISIAQSSLQRAGVLKSGTQELTAYGEKRNSMTASERAKSREHKQSGKSISSLKYNQRTNRAKNK